MTHPRIIALVPLCALAIAFVGCSKSNSSADGVSGKVTLDGKPVGGMVTFIGSGKEFSSTILADGTYNVTELPAGEYKIVVKSISVDVPGAGKGAMKGPSAEGAPMPSAGAVPPKKYATAAGGLTYKYEGGKKTHNIELTP